MKEEDIDGTVMDDVDGIPLEEIDGMPLDGEPLKDKSDDDINGVPLKSIVPYGDDIDGEPCMYPFPKLAVYCECIVLLNVSSTFELLAMMFY